jgi:hypothetical protein
MFERPVDLKVGVNHITLLSTAMGMKVKICQNSEISLASKVKKVWL